MRARYFFVLDIVLILFATVAAQLLRDNLEWSDSRFSALLPYLCFTIVVAAVAVPLSGLNRTVWRLSSLPDYQRAATVAAVVTLGALGLTFAYNRLDGISRSLPILQVLLAIVLMVGLRVLFRIWKAQRKARKVRAVAPLTSVKQRPVRYVLVVGLNRLTETYLHTIEEFEPGRVKVVGLLGQQDRHVGRVAGAHEVLGVPENIETVLRDLKVHGIAVDRIVVTSRFENMSEPARAALLAVEQRGEIEMQFLSEALGFENRARPSSGSSVADKTVVLFEIPKKQLEVMGRRPYWAFKRFGDALIAAVMLVLLSPLMLVLATAIAIEIGVPVTFWQKRPGLGGLPFRLYKFRTMGPAHDAHGKLLTDEQRTSWLGRFLRRSRLDELPQLYNIVRGEMSFVGPRPLLPRDQTDGHGARLLVRPGLTGWAQVVGGRIISADDKAALDIWYVHNASLALDIAILLRTARMVILGEKVSESLVTSAWRDLTEAGFLRRDDDAADSCVRGAA